ncbi:MAG: hypothetical protein HY360_16320 [Verrucomicrobia bacterium]|nr:hypothetical protein [Verrucomicrobiota bacterium]
MQTLTQHWLIPKDRRVHLDLTLPPETPEGEVDVLLIIEPRSGNGNTGVENLIGCLKDSKTFAQDAVQSQRRLRDEWV